jgi:uncharacterized coiled-coil DUF342 family protein
VHHRGEAQAAAKKLVQLEKERDKYSVQAGEANACYLQALEEVKLREVALVELQKRLGDGEGRLKQQQALYEAVRADRNLYSKSLIEAQVRQRRCSKQPRCRMMLPRSAAGWQRVDCYDLRQLVQVAACTKLVLP